MDIEKLKEKFTIGDHVKITSGNGGWPYVHLENNGATAFISLYGAHVLHYTPKGGTDVLWNTPASFFEQGKPIRGGIPVCWPWFGPHASDPTKPMHGFARLSMWNIEKTGITGNGETELVLSMSDNATTRELWPYTFKAWFTVRLGNQLSLTFSVQNNGNEPFTFADALHTYFKAGDASKITIEGLEGCTYLDGTNNNNKLVQTEKMVELKKEENRRYLDTSSGCIIHDPVLGREIKVDKHNSNTTVVWNPWINTAKSMPDFDDEGYKTMVCVEAANAFSDTITLQPGQKFEMGTTLGIL